MNKYVYLFELRRELSFMTLEEKEAAVRFYEELFADAGAENEKQTIENLGPPSSLAAEIRKEYEDGKTQPTGRDLATLDSDVNNGGQGDTESNTRKNVWRGKHWVGPNPPWRDNAADDGAEEEHNQDADSSNGKSSYHYEYDYKYGPDNQASDSGEWESRAAEWGRKAGEWGERAGYEAGKWGQKAGEKAEEWGRKAGEWGERAGYKAGEWSKRAERKAAEWSDEVGSRRRTSHSEYDGENGGYRHRAWNRADGQGHKLPGWAVLLIILLAIPVGIPVIATAGSLVIAAFAAFFGIFAGLFGTGIGLTFGGVALIINAAFTLYGHFADAVMSLGTGLVMIAVGIPLTRFSVWLAKVMWKTLMRGIGSLKARLSRKEESGYETKE